MRRSLCLLLSLLPVGLAVGIGTTAQAAKSGPVVSVLTNDGQSREGQLASATLRIVVDAKPREVALSDVLSVHMADPASAWESQRISAGLTAIAGPDRKAREVASEQIADLGLAALTPVLATYKDTDAREPNPLYHLFARLVPGHADSVHRNLHLIRLADGSALRGDVVPVDLKLTAGGKSETIPTSALRRLAVRRKSIDRSLEVHSLRHSTQIEFMDTGVALTPESKVKEEAAGFVRLSFDVDGWASDPDGLKVPGPNYKTHLVDGFPFGALVGRVGATGERWFAGRKAEKSKLPAGRLYLAVNDNPHWQNNIGSFRVKLHVTDAYDIADPN